MSQDFNVIEAKFTYRDRKCVIGPLWQYDYGKILKITGISLPDMYEVHFSNDPHGIAKTITGNSDGVSIPDEYLLSGASVFAWLFLHNGSKDGGTALQIEITVRRRARAIEIPPTPVEQTVIKQLIADMNVALEKAEHERELSEEAANKSEESIEESQNAAELSKSYAVGGTGTRDCEDEDNAKFWSEQSKQSFENARTHATNAENSKNAAVDSERNAKQSEEKAKISETNAGSSEANAKQSEQEAKQSENKAKLSEDAAALSEQNAADSESAAQQSKADAENAAGDADSSAKMSESFARGRTGVREGEDTDNAEFYSQQAKKLVDDAAEEINDIRELLSGLSVRVNAVLDSDDETLDQMSEIAAYIKSNKSLIDAITTSKVSVSDIVNDLVTNVADKPLSAAQGVALKQLIDDLQAIIPGSGGSGIAVFGATVGQTIKVSAVDENGKPTAWEAVDFPESTNDSDALEALAECGIIMPAYQDGTFYTDANGAIYIL